MSVEDHDNRIAGFTMNLRSKIDHSPMVLRQWLIVLVATFLNALDGFDVLAMAFTANPVSHDFSLNGSQLGLLLSAGLVGMAAGSLILGPLADKYGRRRLLLLSLIINGAGLILSATAQNSLQLGVWRFLTGIGVGGILATITVIISEFTNHRSRGMAISIYTAGYGVGATLGGAGAAKMIPVFGWQSVFFLGFILTIIALVLTWIYIPESLDYLMSLRGSAARQQISTIASKISLDLEDVDFDRDTSGQFSDKRKSILDLFSGGNSRSTLKLWIAFFFVMFGFYFANSWTPKLLVEEGLSEGQGIIGGLALTLGGTFGSLVYGSLTIRFDERILLQIFIVFSGVALFCFISSVSLPPLAFLLGVLVGMLINGCVAGMYTVTPGSYPAMLRSSGVGWGIGVGRIGAILAPMLVGRLLDAGWTPFWLYSLVSAAVLVAAVALFGLHSRLSEDGLEES
nr:MFS transporter [Corynebacterium poyangense]